ncbi:MAG: right-handed parallel beta-helix repeat-containing protein [Myxococcaceae bacterium]
MQLVGGYDRDFKKRNPWTSRTELLWDKASKNWPKDPRLLSNAKNTVVDGLVIDMKDQNAYVDDELTGRAGSPTGETAMRFSQPVTVRNSVIINPGTNAIECVPGSTIENNLLVNALGWAVSVYTSTGDFAKMTALVKSNTILFSQDRRKPGAGGYDGAAVATRGPVNITNNILAHSDNNAIYQTYLAEKVSVTKNVFFMSLHSNFKFYAEGRDVVVDDKSMDLLEEVGLKASDGNTVANPRFDVDPQWMDMFSKRTAAQEGKLVMDDWNQMRKAMGLPLIGSGGKAASGVAPAWELAKAMKLLSPKNPQVKAGARELPLEVKPFAAVAAGPAKAYEKLSLLSWHKQPDGVEGKAIEMLVAIGGVANIGSMPAQYAKDSHLGYFLYDNEGKGERVTGFMAKGTNNERVCDGATGRYDGRGMPEHLFVARGIAHATGGYPKAAFFVESIERYEPAAGVAAVRPPGRDWFVRAGATGGDGSMDKPFKDPFQALEKVESGDTVHVTEGEYVGKLRIGTWKIDTTHIAMLGGYTRDFKERNPWKHPSLLYTPAEFKGRRGGYTIEGADDHSGAIIDGFVFDKKLNNLYQQNGDLDQSRSDKTEHLWLSRPDCIIRNNVFVNGAMGALRIANGQIIENNILINHMTQTVDISSGHSTAPAVFRNNTVLFSWDKRFGQGHGSNGHLLSLGNRVRAVVDNNIFEFADNDAIRQNADAREVELTRNVFAHNLWSHVQVMAGNVSVDDKNWKQLPDLGWKKSEGNELATPGLPLDEKWFDAYLGRTAMVPGKVEMNDWNKLREMLGQPVIATGGAAAEGMAKAYDWKKALTLFPKNPKVTAGARAANLPVKFEGTAPKEEAQHEYTEVTWDTAKDRTAWDKLDGQRVKLTIAIRSTDNQYYLEDIKEAAFQCFTVSGPTGEEGGLPLRAYVKKGTRYERAMKQAKGFGTGKPEETHVLKGIARGNRQLVAEIIERAD